jgi:hypothetical protein
VFSAKPSPNGQSSNVELLPQGAKLCVGFMGVPQSAQKLMRVVHAVQLPRLCMDLKPVKHEMSALRECVGFVNSKTSVIDWASCVAPGCLGESHAELQIIQNA